MIMLSSQLNIVLIDRPNESVAICLKKKTLFEWRCLNFHGSVEWNQFVIGPFAALQSWGAGHLMSLIIGWPRCPACIPVLLLLLMCAGTRGGSATAPSPSLSPSLPPSLHLLLVPVPTHPSSPSPIFFHELIYGANAASTLLCLFPPVLIIKTVSMLRVSSARSILNITSVTLSHPPSLPLPRLLLPL